MGQGSKREQRGDKRDRQGATVTTRRRSTGDSMARRLRAQAIPHARVAGTAAVGAAGAGLGAVTDPTTVGLALGLGGAGLAGIAAAVRRRGWTGRQRVGWVGAAGWCGWVAASGLSWPAAAVLAVGGYGGHLRHWRERRIPDPPAVAPPEPARDVLDPVELWAEHVGCQGGALPGSTLSGERRIATGRRYLVHLKPGRQSLSSALTAVPQLRTGLRLYPWQDLAIERHPQTDEATVRMTLVERSPVLSTAQPWPGPESVYDPDSGTVAIGPHTDGDGVARWRAVSPDSLWGGYITGSIGSGKSRTLESLALGLAAGGLVIWYADGQDGSSSPYLAEHADWSVIGTAGVRRMLEAAQRVKRARQLTNRIHRWTGWRPEQGRPGLVVIIDECHVPLADRQCQALAASLAREGRKAGVAVVLASQVATLDAFGGQQDADALRSSVCSGNVLLMKTMSRNTRTVLPGVNIDPTEFPSLPGYAHLVDYSGERRSAPCRSYHLDDATMEDAATRVTWTELETESAAAAGEDYARRGEDDGADAELAAELAALTGQGSAPSAAPSSPAPAGPRTPQVPEFPTFPSGAGGAGGGDRDDGGTAVEAVRAALAAADGPLRPADLQHQTGYGQTRVRQAITELVDTGAVVKTGYGRYALATQDAAV